MENSLGRESHYRTAKTGLARRRSILSANDLRCGCRVGYQDSHAAVDHSQCRFEAGVKAIQDAIRNLESAEEFDYPGNNLGERVEGLKFALTALSFLPKERSKST